MDGIEMRLDPSLLGQQAPIISYRQIAAVRLLQLSSQDLEQMIVRERVENPALDAEVHVCCPRCNTVLDTPGAPCPGCGAMAGSMSAREHDEDSGDEQGGGHGQWEMDDGDPLYRVPAATQTGQGLLQLLCLALPDEDEEIAEYLVGSLDSHGFLPKNVVEEAAETLRCGAERIERVLAALHRLDPAGIGARGARECLLIQLQRLAESGYPHPLAEILVRDHLKPLAFRRFREVAHALGIMPKKVEAEWDFIRRNLYPYPAHGFEGEGADVAVAAAPVRPDVIIRRREGGYVAEVVERNRYALRVSDEYLWARKHLSELHCDEADRTHIRSYIEQAQTFISALRQRWDTMQRVTDALIEVQRDYLEYGQTALKPLTRADIAQRLGLHESTVSRATDGKFVLLPNGRTVPFDDFFDASLPIRKALTEIIASENPRKPYSDELLMRILAQRGLLIARRTIAKYREEMGILPSRLRRQRPVSRGRGRKASASVAVAAGG